MDEDISNIEGTNLQAVFFAVKFSKEFWKDGSCFVEYINVVVVGAMFFAMMAEIRL